MTKLTLTRTRIQAGRYEAQLASDSPRSQPRLFASYMGNRLDGLNISQPQTQISSEAPLQARVWHVTFDIPAALLSGGVQTVIFLDDETGETLDSLTLMTGQPASDDLRGEIDLLRQELDMLKKAFRRHCRETG